MEARVFGGSNTQLLGGKILGEIKREIFESIRARKFRVIETDFLRGNFEGSEG